MSRHAYAKVLLMTSVKALICCKSVLWLEMDWLNCLTVLLRVIMSDIASYLAVYLLIIFLSVCLSLSLFFLICTSCTILNVVKCEVITHPGTAISDPTIGLFSVVPLMDSILLGSPLFPGSALDRTWSDRCNDLSRAVERPVSYTHLTLPTKRIV